MRQAFVVNQKMMTDLLKSLGMANGLVRRVVVDFEVGKPAKVYCDLFADKEILSSGFPNGMIENQTEDPNFTVVESKYGDFKNEIK